MYDVIIIGGGASGLTLANVLKKRGKKFIVLEKEDRVGKKILVTGNGKCNMSNTIMNASFYNNEFVKNVLDIDVISYFKALGLVTKVTENRIYPYSESATNVVNVLRKNIEDELRCEQEVTRIERTAEGFKVGGLLTKNVALCTGSNATKGTASYNLFKPFGHERTKLVPSIAPLVTDVKYTKGLAGVRFKAELSLYERGEKIAARKGEVLFKENGLSGIVSMELSSFIARRGGGDGFTIGIDFIPEYDIEYLEEFFKREEPTAFLPKGIALAALKQSSDKNISLARCVKNFTVENVKVGDTKNAQVICGGLRTDEFDENLQSKLCPGLYALGEVLDVDGECGGYNLHFAFACGIKVGESI